MRHWAHGKAMIIDDLSGEGQNASFGNILGPSVDNLNEQRSYGQTDILPPVVEFMEEFDGFRLRARMCGHFWLASSFVRVPSVLDPVTLGLKHERFLGVGGGD